MSITAFVRPYFAHRYRKIERFFTAAEDTQRRVLAQLLAKGKNTEWGAQHHFAQCHSYEDFARLSPITTYEDLKAPIDRMRRGERNVLWPGLVRWYAKSSGTTNDKSKFIPVTADGLKDTHYRGGTDAVAIYLHNYPQARLFDGRALILGGSHAPNYNTPHSLVGDLSAILIENIPTFASLFRTPKKSTALLADFEEKRQRIAQEAIRQRVTNISGVPSWMMSVLNCALDITGKASVAEIWPNLEVFFHGGVAFTPYREQYARLMNNPAMRYEETYNASEGFFGLQNDPTDPAMLLMLDYGVFYEFIPLEDIDSPAPNIVPLWGVETGRNYAMVITTSGGLWRYMIGDTVRFTDTAPYKFVISGRTKSFINAFGEELIVDNAEQGLQKACAVTGAEVSEYTAAPVFMDEQGRCCHQWVIEFAVPPSDLALFRHTLDQALQTINSDYEAKRFKDLTLQELDIVVARPGLFTAWLASRGKLGGQHKVPRLSNNRTIIEEVLRLNEA
ncbi:MAG: GH3 auxin-responsive promoter family protein [Bacteroidales bacterium]|nr:GH3 auxin-responsive promoter family protein [Bacteroidales bacterium]